MGARARGRHARSRRTAARALTRDAIIATALALLDREGQEAVTMRRVADALGVTPMALYNHVSSKTDLLRALAEHVVSGVDFDAGGGDWREQIRHCFRVLRATCLRHPGIPRLLETAGMAPATIFAPMEVTLRALAQAGLGDLDAVRAYFTLVGFTLNQAGHQARGPVPEMEPSRRVRIERLAGRGYTRVETLDIPEDWDFDAAFEFGLTLILDGIEAQAKEAR